MKISGNESTGNKSTHNSHILSTSNNYFIWGNQFVGNDQTYICSEKKIILRPPGMLLKCTKCLLLHLLAFCVLCCRWHPPPTDRLVDFFFLDLLKRIHLHLKYVREMASVSAAVTVFGRQAVDVCLCDKDKIYLAADATIRSVLHVLEH